MLDGLKRIVNSAKVQLLASAAFGAVVTYLMTPGSREDKAGLLNTMVVTLGALVGAVILGWAHEDSAAKSAPSQQVNVGSKVDNTAATPGAQAASAPVFPATDAFTPAQREAMHREFAAYIVAHTKPRPVAPAPIDAPKGS